MGPKLALEAIPPSSLGRPVSSILRPWSLAVPVQGHLAVTFHRNTHFFSFHSVCELLGSIPREA